MANIVAMNEKRKQKKLEAEALKNNQSKEGNEQQSGQNEKEKEQKQELDEQIKLGLQIDAELKAIVDAGTTELALEALKSKAPKTYSVVFENYEENGENGVETSFYSATEKSKGVFTISKK